MESQRVVEKVIQIDPGLCLGCGSCINSCQIEAIHLRDYLAEIDYDLCTACEACLEACPNGAIIAVTAPQTNTPLTEQTGTQIGREIAQPPAQMPKVITPAFGAKPLAGAALAFIGSEVAPRLVDVLVKSIEQRLTQPAKTSQSVSCPRYHPQRRGLRKQIRHRGGNMSNHS